jgi:hypothetical protein
MVPLSGVVYVLVDDALELLLLMVHVIYPEADVSYSLAELMIASSRE